MATMEGTFREIPEEEIPLLLNDLEKDIPVSIHPWAFLKVIEKWRTVDRSLDRKILALNGNFRTRMILFYTLSSDKQYLRGMIHKWSHSEDDADSMTEALKQTKETVPWYVKHVELPDLTPETSTVVKPAMADIWKTEKWEIVCAEWLYWIPKGVAAAWTIDIPNGTRLSFLNDTHLKEVLELWPWTDEGSEELFKAVLQVNFGLGLFDCKTGELMSWAIQKYYGGIGVLNTKEKHRRKGYGFIVLKATAKEMAKRGFDIHAMVSKDNVASKSLFAKCGFRLVDSTYWVEKKGKKTEL